MSSQTSNEQLTIFENSAAVIAPRIVQFMGASSLAHFSLTCKCNHGFVRNEVVQRKTRFHECRQEIEALLGDPLTNTPSRDEVSNARILREVAINLIWSESNDEPSQADISLTTTLLFHEEQSVDLHILPDCFYFPISGESVDVSLSNSLMVSSAIGVFLMWRATVLVDPFIPSPVFFCIARVYSTTVKKREALRVAARAFVRLLRPATENFFSVILAKVEEETVDIIPFFTLLVDALDEEEKHYIQNHYEAALETWLGFFPRLKNS